jgi:Flp pilus assembly pilin Flp
MTRINNFFLNIVARAQAAKNEEGQGTVEYVLVTALVAVAAVVAAIGLDTAITDAVGKLTSAISSAA